MKARLFSRVIPIIAILLLGTAFVFAGGQKEGGKTDEVAEGKRIDAVGPYIARTGVSGEVVFSNGWGGSRIPLMEAQIENFNKYYPNVKINSEVVKPADLEKVNMSAMAAGAPADVMMLKASLIPFLVDQDAVLPIDELVERDEIEPYEIFYSGELDTRKYRNKLWGLPNVGGGSRHYLYINLDMVDQAGLDPNNLPETWQDLNHWADVVRERLPDSYLLEPNHTAGAHPPMLVWMTVNNGKYINEDLTEITFNSQEGLETLEWMLQFVKRQAGRYSDMAMTEAPRMAGIHAGAWTTNVYMCATQGVGWVSQLLEGAPDLNWTATLLPYNGDNPKAEFGTPTFAGWTFMMPKGLKNPEAAWEWIKYTCAGEGQHKFIVQDQLRPSPAKIYNDDPLPAEGNPIWDVIVQDLEVAKPIAVTPVHANLREIMYMVGEEVLFEKKSPKQALEDGAEEAQKILDEWNAQR